MHLTRVFPKTKEKLYNTKLHQRVEEVSGIETARNIAVQLYMLPLCILLSCSHHQATASLDAFLLCSQRPNSFWPFLWWAACSFIWSVHQVGCVHVAFQLLLVERCEHCKNLSPPQGTSEFYVHNSNMSKYTRAKKHQGPNTPNPNASKIEENLHHKAPQKIEEVSV